VDKLPDTTADIKKFQKILEKTKINQRHREQKDDVRDTNDLGKRQRTWGDEEMGGRGSGWQRQRKTTVEEGLVLDVKVLVAIGALVPGAYRRGSLTCQYDGCEFEYESELRQDGTGFLFLRCVGPGQQFCHWVSLCSTLPHYGGRRWWFICPIKKIRVAKLYLPPGATTFASRQAYSLTYRSCQRPFRIERVRRRTERLARQMTSEAEFRALLDRLSQA
jgi:hypothetical protein